ncbi:hypothetical protein [Streptomyces sporangiiformans]|uniref:Uncharacterized protein n=1 Tax=Streptomyces sporangiiformans TaxID=2315329 RepID=A0A505D6M4_9ACTN|nr:hypothetical protein [Streptomyces sporangiiformans]TPQ20143.1 hypothetical protein FGD71_021845 [Streptomyces sporangiiformans]
MGEWTPVVYRGDGAWIGVMPSGEIGVGTEVEGRATLEGSRFIPMWPFLERDFSECLSEFSRLGESPARGGTPPPEKLIELTVGSAWKSGRPYWMRLAVPWAIEMVQRSEFDSEAMGNLLGEMLDSEIVEPEMRERLRRFSSMLSDSLEDRD